MMLITPSGTFQGGFSSLLCKECTKVFPGASFWGHAQLQNSVVDKYIHWLSLVFLPIQKCLEEITQTIKKMMGWYNDVMNSY